MAQEDLLPQMFAEFYAKANPDPPSDNQQLNKIEVPNDQMTIGVVANAYVFPSSISQSISETLKMSSGATAATLDPSTFAWGGNDSNGTLQSAGWAWGLGGAWG